MLESLITDLRPLKLVKGSVHTRMLEISYISMVANANLKVAFYLMQRA